MPFKVEGPVAEEEMIKSPLNPEEPIATLLEKIPGIGPFLKGVQQQTSPKGFYGPGLLAQILGGMTHTTPQKVYDTMVPQQEMAAGIAGQMALPGATIPARIAGGALIPMLEHLASGNVQSPGMGLLKGVAGGAGQGVMEGLMGAIKQPFMRSAAKAADAAHETALAQHETNALAAQSAYAGAKDLHAGQAATSIMDQLKSVVPAYRGLPSDTAGLTEAVLGNGPKLLSKEFDKSMQQIVSQAGNTTIQMPLTDLQALKVPLMDVVNTPGPRDVIFGTARAADVAEVVTGTGAKDWRRYRRVVEALDKAGIGDPEARQAYKTGFGVNDFLGKSKAIEILPEGSVLHTDRIVKALSDPKLVDLLRKRDIGTANEGIMQAARAGTPAAPIPEPSPLNPRDTGDLTEQSLGTPWKRAKVGGLLGALGGMATGTGHSLYYSPPAIAGALGGYAAPNEWITKAPGTEPLIQLLGELGKLGGATAREVLTPRGVPVEATPSSEPD